MEPGDRWTELTINDDGISVSLYELQEDDQIEVVEEAWLTDSEIQAKRAISTVEGEDERHFTLGKE